MQTVFKVRTPSGDERALAFNQTSINKLIDAHGDESSAWRGLRVLVWAVMSNIGGKMKKVAYFTVPDQTLDDDSVEYGDENEALPGFVWVEVEAAAVEVDGRHEVLGVAETTGRLLDPLDDGVESLETGIG